MADETLLSDLCSICNTTKSKYRCPGCSARTCSLPCYKRHQQWAQCSGKRDPTAYVKKSQLATPAGIDHDYNFLTSIERGLEKAERDVTSRGVSTTPLEPQKGSKKGEIHPSAFRNAGVTVIRAPKGLSRQKENSTHRNSKRNIIWTVEWFHPDATRALSKVSEREPLWEAYRDITGKPRIKKRKREIKNQPAPEEDSAGSNKRQHAAAAAHTGTPHSPEVHDPAVPTSVAQQQLQPESQLESQPDSHSEPQTDLNELQPQQLQPDSEPPAVSQPEPAPTAGPKQDAKVAGTDGAPEDFDPEINEFHFFLHRPRTTSTRAVLIPVPSTATLSECLRGKTVLEFPTIYVFDGPIPQPGEKFVLEEEYERELEEQRRELEDVMKDVAPETLKAIEARAKEEQAGEGEVDSGKILDVLRKDVDLRGGI